jgi:hypothetical protein
MAVVGIFVHRPKKVEAATPQQGRLSIAAQELGFETALGYVQTGK